ncbi:MAG: hypothetical protein QXD98_03925 [Candidatus Diapherotrites archaeon]
MKTFLLLFHLIFFFLLIFSGSVNAATNLVKISLSTENNQKEYYLNNTPVQEIKWVVTATKLHDSVNYVDVNLIRIKVGDTNKFSYTHQTLNLPYKVIRIVFPGAITTSSYKYNYLPKLNYMNDVRTPFFEEGAYIYYASVVYVHTSSPQTEQVISDNSSTYAIVVKNKKTVVSELNHLLVLLICLSAIGILTYKSSKNNNIF